MTELETMQRAKMYMDKLALGIDPITNQEVAEDSALNNVRLARCFFYVSGILEQVIENDGYVGAKPKQHPFSITSNQLTRVQLSRDPVRLTQFADLLWQAVGDPLMKKPSTSTISNWLLDKGFLEKQSTPDGKSKRVPTHNGMMLGITTQMRQSQYGEYMTVLYNTQAQQFVLDHLCEMLA